MKDKTFHRLLTAVILLGSLSTIALLLWSIHLQKICSIISYIANGR